jgi:hypothetical protein
MSDQLVETNSSKPSCITTMLPWRAPIQSEPDEASILSALFSKPVKHNEFPMTSLKSHNIESHKVTLLPYEIAHSSEYEPDDMYSDDTRLIAEELSYAGYHPNFNMEPDFSLHDIHPGNYKPPGNYQQYAQGMGIDSYRMPTMWNCVRNAFNMSLR